MIYFTQNNWPVMGQLFPGINDFNFNYYFSLETFGCNAD
jgi:hypothetical protein